MYCKYCGTHIADDSAFCSKCGKPTGNTQVQEPKTSDDWEYMTMGKTTPKGEFYDSVVDSVYLTEASARITLWNRHKQTIMDGLKPYFDDGWQPVSEIDESCLMIKSSSEHGKGLAQGIASALGYSWWLVGMNIPLRRRASAKSAEEKKFFDLILVNSGRNKIETIKVIRNLIKLGLGEAKTLCETPNGVILRNVDKSTALHAQSLFERAGASTKIV